MAPWYDPTTVGTKTGVTAPAGATIINPGDNANSIIAASGPNTKFYFTAGTHRGVRVDYGNMKSGMEFVGEYGAILNGSVVLTGWTLDGGLYRVSRAYSLNPYELESVCQVGHGRCDFLSDLYLDDVPLEHQESKAAVNAPGEWFYDYGAGVIWMYDNPAGRLVELGATYWALSTGEGYGSPASNVIIRNLRVEKYATLRQRGAIHCDGGSGWQVTNCEIRLNHGTGVKLGAGGVLRDCRVNDNGQRGVGGSGSGVLVENNEMARNNYAHYNWTWEAGASKFVGTTDLICRANYVHDNEGAGLWTDIQNGNTLFEYNVLDDNRYISLFHEISWSGTIRYNLCRDNFADYWATITVSCAGPTEVYGNEILVPNDPTTGTGAILVLSNDRGSPYQYATANIHDNTIAMRGTNSKAFKWWLDGSKSYSQAIVNSCDAVQNGNDVYAASGHSGTAYTRPSLTSYYGSDANLSSIRTFCGFESTGTFQTVADPASYITSGYPWGDDPAPDPDPDPGPDPDPEPPDPEPPTTGWLGLHDGTRTALRMYDGERKLIRLYNGPDLVWQSPEGSGLVVYDADATFDITSPYTMLLPSTIIAGSKLLLFASCAQKNQTAALTGLTATRIGYTYPPSANANLVAWLADVSSADEGRELTVTWSDYARPTVFAWMLVGGMSQVDVLTASSSDWAASITSPTATVTTDGTIEVQAVVGARAGNSPSTGYQIPASFADAETVQAHTTGLGDVQNTSIALAYSTGTRAAAASIGGDVWALATGDGSAGWCAMTLGLRPSQSTIPDPGAVQLRINCGSGSTVTDSGVAWQPDSNYLGIPADTLTRTGPSYSKAILNTMREHPVAYRIPMPNGCYEVDLWFAEPDSGTTAGQRVTDYWVNGRTGQVDVAAEDGQDGEVIETVQSVKVTDSVLDIRLVQSGTLSPVICGIEVREGSSCAGDLTTSGTNIESAIESAVASGSNYQATPAIYTVTGTITCSNPSGSVIDGQGSILNFTASSPTAQPTMFNVIGNGNLTIKNFELRQDPLPFTQGRVTAKTSSQVTVAIDAGYPDPAPWVRSTSVRTPFFTSAGVLKRPFLNTTVARVNATTATLTVSGGTSTISVGDLVAINSRSPNNPALVTQGGNGQVVFENITIRSSNGLATLVQSRRGNVTYKWVTVKRMDMPSRPALITSNVDMFRAKVSAASVYVLGCHTERHCDDGSNFHGHPFSVKNVESSTSLILTSVMTLNKPHTVFEPGQQLRLMSLPNKAVVATRTISSITSIGGNDYRVVLTSGVSASTAMIADIPQHNCPNSRIRGSWFSHHGAYSTRIKSNSMEITGSRMDTAGGIIMRPDIWSDSWKESGWADGVLIDHCHILSIQGNAIRVAEDESTYSGHTDLTVSNNRIDTATGYGITLANVNGAVLDGNTLIGTNGVQVLSTAVNVTQS